MNRAAEAAVGQFHQATIQFLGITEAAGSQQVAIDADLTELIDQNGEFQPAFQQEVTQQGGFAGAEETGHHGDRQPAGRRDGHAQPTRADQVQAAPRPSNTAAMVRRVVAEQAAALWRSTPRATRSSAPWLISNPIR